MTSDGHVFNPIGTIHTDFTEKAGTPIQGRFAPKARGEVHLLPEFANGLDDLDGFSHVYLIYVFDRAPGFTLKCMPFRDDVERGVFATRAPRRPNPIGITVVTLMARRGNVLAVSGVDMLNGTPLLDIKPYVPMFDEREDVRIGWLADSVDRRTADERFEE